MSGGSGTSGVTMDDINTLMSQGTSTNTVNAALQPAMGAATDQANALSTTAAEAAPAASSAATVAPAATAQAVDGASAWSTPWIGKNQTPQTWNKASKPKWMTGSWDMPSWGTSAATGEDVPASNSTLAGETAGGASSGITAADVAAMIAAAQGETAGKAETYQSTGDPFIDLSMEDMIDRGDMSAADANKSMANTRQTNLDLAKRLEEQDAARRATGESGLQYTGYRPNFG